MPEPIDFDVTISLRVTDRSALYRAALAEAKRTGLTRLDWRDMRRDASHPTPTHADLQMLLDPGGATGLASASGLKVYSTTAKEADEDGGTW